VAVIDLTINQVIKTIPVQGKPVGVAVNHPLAQAYISTPEGNGFVVAI
jgi:DNA-binding beta-propeller fold protein YncE